MTALSSCIFLATYSGERWAIPVPLAFAEDSISAVIVVAYDISAAVAVLIMILACSNLFEIERMKKIE